MSKVKRYMKKPIAIEALQLTWENWDEMCKFIGITNERLYMEGDSVELTITTLEGDITAHTGDYIIKGVKGELYSCRKDIFEETYDCIEHLYNEKQGKKVVKAFENPLMAFRNKPVPENAAELEAEAKRMDRDRDLIRFKKPPNCS